MLICSKNEHLPQYLQASVFSAIKLHLPFRFFLFLLFYVIFVHFISEQFGSKAIGKTRPGFLVAWTGSLHGSQVPK